MPFSPPTDSEVFALAFATPKQQGEHVLDRVDKATLELPLFLETARVPLRLGRMFEVRRRLTVARDDLTYTIGRMVAHERRQR